MKTQHLYYKLALAAALLACASAASADINKCVDREGRVLFTDAPCGDANVAPHSVPATGAPNEGVTLAAGQAQLGTADASAAETPSAPRVHGDNVTIQARDVRSAWASLPRPMQRRAVSLDASTLQAARSTMVLQDTLRHQERIASR